MRAVDIELLSKQRPDQPCRVLAAQESRLEEQTGTAYHPEMVAVFLWRTANVMVILYFLIEIPFVIAFGPLLTPGAMEVLRGVQIGLLAMQVVEAVSNFFIAGYVEGRLVRDRRLLMREYLRRKAWIDIAGLIALLIPLVVGGGWEYLGLLYVVKLYEVWEYGDLLRSQLFRREQVGVLFLTLQIAFSVVIFTHYMSCGAYLVSRLVLVNQLYGPETSQVCWITNSSAWSPIYGLSVGWQYVYAMYFGIQILTTIAFGDITPMNPYETTYTIFMYLVAVIWFAYVIEEVIGLLTDNYQRRYEFFRELKAVDRFLRARAVSLPTQQRVLGHFEHVWLSRRYYQAEEQATLDLLTPTLRETLLLQAYAKYYAQLPLFPRLPSKVLLALVPQIQEIHLAPHQPLPLPPAGSASLLFCEDLRYQMVNYPSSGRVRIRKYIVKGKVLGQYSFFMDQDMPFPVESLNNSVLLQLPLQALVGILRQQEIYGLYLRIRDKYWNRSHAHPVYCPFCDSPSHLHFRCPQVYFVPPKIPQRHRRNVRSSADRLNKITKRIKIRQPIFRPEDIAIPEPEVARKIQEVLYKASVYLGQLAFDGGISGIPAEQQQQRLKDKVFQSRRQWDSFYEGFNISSLLEQDIDLEHEQAEIENLAQSSQSRIQQSEDSEED